MFKDRKFSGEESKIILKFLTRPMEETDALEISEGQLIALLPHLIAKSVTDKYWAAPTDPVPVT